MRIERRLEYGWKEAERAQAAVQVRARESLIIVSYRLRSTWPFSKTLLRFCSFVTQVHGARRGERVFISRPARLEAEELTVLCMPPGGQTTSISQRTTVLKTRGAARCVAAAAASARCAPRRCPYNTPTASIIMRYCPCRHPLLCHASQSEEQVTSRCSSAASTSRVHRPLTKA